MKIYLSSESLNPKELSQEEHGSNRIDAVREHFGFKEKRDTEEDINSYSKEYEIESWINPTTPLDYSGKPLDIIRIKNNKSDKSFWLPRIEYKYLQEIANNFSEKYNLSIGYVDGRTSHLGKFQQNGMFSASLYRGYVLVVEYSILKEYKPIGEYDI